LLVIDDTLLGRTVSQALVQPYEGAIPLSIGTSVSVNGVPLSPDGGSSGFYSDRLVFDAGSLCTAEVSTPGLSPFQATVPLPGDFAILSPPGDIVAGELLNLSWSPSAGAMGYNVLVEVSDGGTTVPLTVVTTQDSEVSLVVPSQPGKALLTVVALGPQTDRHFSGAVEDQRRILISSPLKDAGAQ
jgi:hypothetical protein